MLTKGEDLGHGPGRRHSCVPLVALLVAASALSGCGATTSNAHDTEHLRTSVMTTSGEFTVSIDAGTLHLIPGPSERVSLHGIATYRGGRPPSVFWQDSGKQVSLRSVCLSRGGDCGYNYTISLPVPITVVADVAAGDISAKGLAGPLRLSATAGNVTLASVSGALDVTTGSGDVTGAGLRSRSTNIWEGTGNVTLGFTAAPWQLVVKASTGDVGVTVPRSFSYHVSTSDELGDVSSGITDDPSSPRVVSLSVGTGNVFLNQFGG